jgi:hypothetical protein
MMLEDMYILNANTADGNFTKSKTQFIEEIFSHYCDFLYMDFYK